MPNLANSAAGNVSSRRLISAIDPTLCSSLKDRGIKIAVLYTTYLPITNNSFYNQWVAPISSTIGQNLQTCASPGLYFEVNPSQGIGQAMQALFKRRSP